MGYLFENGLSKEGTGWGSLTGTSNQVGIHSLWSNGIGVHTCHPPDCLCIVYIYIYVETHHQKTLYVYRTALFLCLLRDVCAVYEVAGVWCLGPEGWRCDHQRLPPIDLECSRGVKIGIGESVPCFAKFSWCWPSLRLYQHIYHILFMTYYMLQVACISVHNLQMFSNMWSTTLYGRDMFVSGMSYILQFVACFHISLYRLLEFIRQW